MKTTKIMPTTCLLIAMFAMIISHIMVPVAWIIPPVWNLAGLAFIAAGMVLNLVADRAFHQAHTTVRPFEESSTLITNSAFRISRNPMYLGFVSILTGLAILLRSLSPYLVMVAFAILMDAIYVRTEERMLAERFGQAWQAYASRARRWL